MNLAKNLGKEYAFGSKSPKEVNQIVNAFHEEMIRQMLLGKRVLLPGDISMEIVREEYFGNVRQPRLGFKYRVRINYDKLKVKKVKFTPNNSLKKSLDLVLRKTNFEYKLVSHVYQ